MSERHVEYMPLATVQTAFRNPKEHDTAGIKASVDRFGLAELPLVDERTGRLVAGHGRLDDLMARRDGGQEPPDGVREDPASGDWLIPVIRGWTSRSDAEAEAYLIASNKLTAKGGWDDAELGRMLADLNDIDSQLMAVTGFTEGELERLLGNDTGSGGDVAPPDDFPSYDDETIHTDFSCPKCGYEWSGGKGRKE